MSDEQKVIIDCDDFWRRQDVVGVAIICSPTNIICTAQVDGMACSHPYVEGFPIDIQVHFTKEFKMALDKFNDCSKHCCLSTIDADNEKYAKYAKDVNLFLSENLNDDQNLNGMAFEFDCDRMDMLTEGWWPVLISFKNNSFHSGKEEIYHKEKFKGYLHFGNCD